MGVKIFTKIISLLSHYDCQGEGRWGSYTMRTMRMALMIIKQPGWHFKNHKSRHQSKVKIFFRWL